MISNYKFLAGILADTNISCQECKVQLDDTNILNLYQVKADRVELNFSMYQTLQLHSKAPKQSNLPHFTYILILFNEQLLNEWD